MFSSPKPNSTANSFLLPAPPPPELNFSTPTTSTHELEILCSTPKSLPPPLELGPTPSSPPSSTTAGAAASAHDHADLAYPFRRLHDHADRPATTSPRAPTVSSSSNSRSSVEPQRLHPARSSSAFTSPPRRASEPHRATLPSSDQRLLAAVPFPRCRHDHLLRHKPRPLPQPMSTAAPQLPQRLPPRHINLHELHLHHPHVPFVELNSAHPACTLAHRRASRRRLLSPTSVPSSPA